MSEKENMCPLKYLTNTFGGKWKLPIICILANKLPHRYSAIKRKLGDITYAHSGGSMGNKRNGF